MKLLLFKKGMLWWEFFEKSIVWKQPQGNPFRTLHVWMYLFVWAGISIENFWSIYALRNGLGDFRMVWYGFLFFSLCVCTSASVSKHDCNQTLEIKIKFHRYPGRSPVPIFSVFCQILDRSTDSFFRYPWASKKQIRTENS